MKIKNIHDFKKHFKNSSQWERESLAAMSDEQIYHDILTTPNEGGACAYDFSRKEELKLHLLPKVDVAKASFVPDPLRPFVYYVHPLTIRAIRKDIFCVGDDFETYEELYQCNNCQKKFDLQFYLLCPYCGHDVDIKLARQIIKSEQI